jgi:hypothetical protein
MSCRCFERRDLVDLKGMMTRARTRGCLAIQPVAENRTVASMIYNHTSLSCSGRKGQLLLEVAEQKRMTMDNYNITALEPARAGPDAGPPAELPPNKHTIEPLDLIENPKVRTKLRIYSILVSLYVHYPVLALSEHKFANNTSSSSSSS